MTTIKQVFCVISINKEIYIVYRYNSATGSFTVPSCGDGFYYFSAHFAVWYYEFAYFDIQINGETICTTFADRNHSDNADPGPTSCSAATYAAEGKKVKYLLLNACFIWYLFSINDIISDII